MTPALSGTPIGNRSHRRVRRLDGERPGRFRRPGGASRLDPAGGAHLPRRSTLLRTLVVTVLLLIAAAVLHAGSVDRPAHPVAADSDPDSSAGTTTPTGSTPAPGPTPESASESQPLPAPESVSAPGPVSVPADLVGVPVPLAEPAMLTVLESGDRVDLLTVAAPGQEPAPIASGVIVLAIDPGTRALVLALTEAQAHTVLSTGGPFAVIARP